MGDDLASFAALRKLKVGAGDARYLFDPATIQNGTELRLLGLPVILTDNIPNAATEGPRRPGGLLQGRRRPRRQRRGEDSRPDLGRLRQHRYPRRVALGLRAAAAEGRHTADGGLAVAEVDSADVAVLVSDSSDTAAVAGLIVPLITTMAKAYTRGHGFDDAGEPFSDVAAAITTACARFVGNPRQASESTAYGPYTIDRRSRGFDGWTLAELAVLNRYRVRAM